MNIEEMLEGEILTELGKLKSMPLGKEEYKVAVDGITKLMDREIEMRKMEVASEERAQNREEDKKNRYFENELRKKQLDDERKNRYIGYAVNGVMFAGSMALSIWGLKSTFRFEETGTITTQIGKGLINTFIPKRK